LSIWLLLAVAVARVVLRVEVAVQVVIEQMCLALHLVEVLLQKLRSVSQVELPTL
jgi:hypothetical protein